ncbi:MAG: hypothetical protein K6A31_10630 [Fibrobacter sp.]|nr:hypothetical protein [Fibrobacter sp.]
MKKTLILAASLLSLNLIGCAAGHKNVDTSWTEAPKTISVLFTEPTVQNKDDVEDDLPEYKDNFSGWFSEQLKAEFAEQTGITPSVVEQKSDDSFDMTVTKLGKKEYKVPNPKFDAIGVDEGFVVSIAFLDISRLSETRMIVPGSFETKSYLQYLGQYTIADVSGKKVVTSGMFKARVTLGFALQKSDWEENVKNLVEEIIKDTPLEKK